MKSFLWRLKSNAVWFLAALAIFTVAYIIYAYGQMKYVVNRVYCLEGFSPVIISLFTCFGFFLIYSKRYTYDEEYFYGHSRKSAFISSQCGAAVFALLFSFYALGLALFVRRGILSNSNFLVSIDLYNITASDIFCNLLFLFVVNMLGYESANMFRKFKSWKFWATLVVSVITVIVLSSAFILFPLNNHTFDLDKYWLVMTAVFASQLLLMVCCDYFMTRGRQYR